MPDAHSNKAAEYRQQAERLRTIAPQISLIDTRRQLLETARHLEVLAEEEERNAQGATSDPDPPRER